MFINYNEELVDQDSPLFSIANRAYKYGDGVFETMKYSYEHIHFWEDHYFRLMASMRIIRMEIPMEFTPEYLEEQIKETIEANHLERQSVAVRLTVTRKAGGKYLPHTNEVDWSIEVNELTSSDYEHQAGLKMDVFKDHYKAQGLLANTKTTNCLIYTVASIYAQENGLDDVVLVNDLKQVVESTNANLFLIVGNRLITPPLETGCLKGIMRKKVLELAKKCDFQIEEKTFSPFEIQRAEEMFLTNSIIGIQSVAQFKKKRFTTEKVQVLLDALNESIH